MTSRDVKEVVAKQLKEASKGKGGEKKSEFLKLGWDDKMCVWSWIVEMATI